MNFFKSIFKNFRLTRFQRAYAKLQEKPVTIENLISDRDLKKKLRAEYIQFCLSDKSVREICEAYQITADDLEATYWQLSIAGLEGFIEGHFASLSTLAFAEPLEFTIVSLRDDRPILNIGAVLQSYWGKEVDVGALLPLIAESKSFIRRDSKATIH